MMELKVEIDRGDFADFNRYYWFRFRKWRSIVYAGLLGACVLWSTSRNQNWDVVSWVIASVLILGGFQILNLVILLVILQVSSRSMPDAKRGSILGAKTYQFSAEGIRAVTATSDSTVKWSGIMMIGQTRRAHYLHVDRNAALIVPKRALTPEREKEFLAMVAAHIH